MLIFTVSCYSYTQYMGRYNYKVLFTVFNICSNRYSITYLNTNLNVGVVSRSMVVDAGVIRFHPIIAFVNWNGGSGGFWLWNATVTVSPSASLADTRYMLNDKPMFSKHEVCWSFVWGFEKTGAAFWTVKLLVMYKILCKMDRQTDRQTNKLNTSRQTFGQAESRSAA